METNVFPTVPERKRKEKENNNYLGNLMLQIKRKGFNCKEQNICLLAK